MRIENETPTPEAVRARHLARQTEAIEQLAEAVEEQNEVLGRLVDVQAHRD